MWQFAGKESGVDADVHVVAGDVVDEGVEEISLEVGGAGAGGFAEEEDVEGLANFAEAEKGVALEVVEEKVGDEDAAGGWGIRGEEIALLPEDAGIEVGGAWGEIEGGDGGSGEAAGKFGGEVAVTGADFGDAFGGGTGEAGGGAEEPTFVAHEEIDHAQVAAAADGVGIVRWKMVEDFRGDEAIGHGGWWNRGCRTSNIER